MKFDLEKFKNGKQRIKCDSQEEYDAVCEFLAKQGFDEIYKEKFDDRYEYVGLHFFEGVIYCWSHVYEVEIVTFDELTELTEKNIEIEIGTNFSQQFGEYRVEWDYGIDYSKEGDFSVLDVYDDNDIVLSIPFKNNNWRAQLEKANQILELYNIPLVLVEPKPKTKRVKIVSTGEIVTVEEVAEQGMYKAVSKENTYIRVRDCVDYNPIQIKRDAQVDLEEYTVCRSGGKVYVYRDEEEIASVEDSFSEKIVFTITGQDVELIG